jgi:putative hydrolase of the HAD superfamily
MRKTVIFDIGNVLVFFSFPKMFRQISNLTGLSEEDVKQEILGNSIGVRHEDGTLSDDELYGLFLAKGTKKFSRSELKEAVSDIFTENPSIYPIVHKLKSKGVQLLLLSNTCPPHIEFLKNRFSIFQEFEEEVLSFKVGARKPDRRIYQEAVRLSGNEPGACFYTDDIPEYVQAARSLGIQAETYTTSEALFENLTKVGFL